MIATLKMLFRKSELKDMILKQRDEGRLVFSSFFGFHSIGIKDFINQPADGILYDLNRLEEVSMTFMTRRGGLKWVNDFAVALTIRALKARIAELEGNAE